jgi:hypothetical protein
VVVLLLSHGRVEDEIVEMEGCNMELNKGCIARQNTRSNSAIVSKVKHR